jgi:hypothetical protein
MVDANNPPPPDPLPPDPESASPPQSKPLSAAEVQAMLDALKQEIRDQVTQALAQAMPAQPGPPPDRYRGFTQSGIFFIPHAGHTRS